MCGVDIKISNLLLYSCLLELEVKDSKDEHLTFKFGVFFLLCKWFAISWSGRMIMLWSGKMMLQRITFMRRYNSHSWIYWPEFAYAIIPNRGGKIDDITLILIKIWNYKNLVYKSFVIQLFIHQFSLCCISKDLEERCRFWRIGSAYIQ